MYRAAHQHVLGPVEVVGCFLASGGAKNLKENSDLPQNPTKNFLLAGG
jgi:hypothetical protein